MDQGEEGKDNAKRLIHNNIKYLHDLCNNKDLNVPALKSLFWTKCKLMELRTKIHLPSEQYKVSTRCSRCFLDRDDNSTLQVRPMRLSKFENKLAAKVEKNKKKILTRFQQKCLTGIKKKFPDGLWCGQNQMVITCSTCKQESTIRMLKPKTIAVQNEVKKLIKGKQKKQAKSKRDKNCGLKAEAVLEAWKKHKLKKKKENFLKKEKPRGELKIVEVIPAVKTIEPSKKDQNNKEVQPRISKSNENERIFATSDFIPLTTQHQGSKFRLSKKQKNPVVNKVIETKAKRKRNQKKGPKPLSEKAKLELFLQNL